jgi:hypothetical protein
MSNELVEFVVGGISYPLDKADIANYPDSFVCAALKKEWHDGKKPIIVERDGNLFKYIHAYLVTGAFSRNSKRHKDKALLEAIRQEAEFFGLPELAKECVMDDVVTPLRAYETIRSFINNAGDGEMRVDHPSGSTTPLLKALGTMWAPFCVKGELFLYNRSQVVFKSSTIGKLNVPELVAAAAPSPFGRGTETVTDLNVRDSLEISADKLNPSALSAISNHVEAYFGGLCPNTPTHLKPYKLVIYQQGGHFDQHRDTVRGDGHIGTVVVILNSEYTGGELEITHGGRTEVVTGPNNWVAMYGDCLHKINPATSGTRVSLIYDIYAAHKEEGKSSDGDRGYHRKNNKKVSTDDDIETCEEIEQFWAGDRYAQKDEGVSKARGVDAPAIHAALNRELEKLDSVVICLQHMYPACQAVPGFLKGADAVLYEVLQDRYEVQVVYCSIYRCGDYEGGAGSDCVQGKLYTSFEKGDTVHGDAARMKLVIPAPINHVGILDYTPFIEHTGNESQAEETVYVTTGLQVSLKK